MEKLSDSIFDKIKRASKLGRALTVGEVNLLISEIESLRQQLAVTHKLWQQSCSDAFVKSKQIVEFQDQIASLQEAVKLEKVEKKV